MGPVPQEEPHMHNQSFFVKATIWFMVFLMSVGFIALVITPFLGSGSLFGDSSGRDATQELLDDARADVRRDKCTTNPAKIDGKREARCREALNELGSAYRSLAAPPSDATSEDDIPKDSRRNLGRAEDAYQAAYELDPANEDSAKQYAAFLRDQGKSQQSLSIWTALVKAYPRNEDYLIQQAAAYSASSQVDKAITSFKLFVTRFPDSGQLTTVKEQIKQLEEQAKPGAAGAGTSPVPVG